MKLTGGQVLVAQLIREGVEHVFGIPGVQLDWAVEAFRQNSAQIKFVVPRHEQAASYMADGYARTGACEGVSMVVPGPGVLNALSGLATAYACSSRTLFIAGQIPSWGIGRNCGLLHEIPGQSEILRRLTKWHALACEARDVATVVNEAFRALRSGRPRPVAIEIPPDVLQQSTDAPLCDRAVILAAGAEEKPLCDAANMLREAKFPVIQAGGGAAAANAGSALTRLAERLQAPVVLTEGARGVIPSDHPLTLTSLGGRAVFPHADLVLAVGTRFLDAKANPIHSDPACRYIYINLDPEHVGTPRKSGLVLAADAHVALRQLNQRLVDLPPRPSRTDEMAAVKSWCEVQLASIEPEASYVHALRSALADDAILVSDLTQVGYFANIAFSVKLAHSYLTPGYQGTLGYGFPTALGAAVRHPTRRIVSLNGDGGFGWNMQELLTAARYRLRVTVIVFVDGHYGNVRRIQRRTFGHEFVTRVANPEFSAFAGSCGVPFRSVDSPHTLREALLESESFKGPLLIEAKVGEMVSPWSVIHSFVPPLTAPPPNPLGSPYKRPESAADS